jgi:hypothetical protein
MRPNLQEEGLVDRETDSSALHVAQSHATLDTYSHYLLGMDRGASGYALVGSPPSRLEGVLSQVRG